MTNLAERMMSLFAGNEAAHGFYGEPTIEPSGKASIRKVAKTVRKPITVEHWQSHLSGGPRPLGVIPIRGDGTCSWGSIDYDVYDADLTTIIARVEELRLPLVPSRSKSGGLHLTLFLTSPALVRDVTTALKCMAVGLGMPGSEIFPKQDKLDLERGDTGTWLTMPYGSNFGGKLKDQVGLDRDGRELTLAEFIEAAERATIDPEKLAEFTNVVKLRPRAAASMALPSDGPFSDGPPCLQALARDGVPEGDGRNNTLFMMGVYARKADPENWRQMVEDLNQRHLNPPLGRDEVKDIIKSLRKKEYRYTCKREPMQSLCDAATCVTRQHGIKGEPERSTSNLPVIEIHAAEFGRAVTETMAALVTARVPLFIRAGSLVTPTMTVMPTASGGKTEVSVLRPVTEANLAVLLTNHAAQFTKHDARSRRAVPIDPPSRVLQGLLQLGQWDFPPVAGIINAPTMRYDGSILDAPGYDPASALYYIPGAGFVLPPIKEEPTKDDARAALGTLSGLIVGYPFVEELDRSITLCSIMTVVTRGAYDVSPMFLLMATTAGTGKSHLVESAGLIARGRSCPVITTGRTAEEFEKRLGSVLLEGSPIVSLDNCISNLEGEMLCQMTERPLIKTRVLGESRTPECQWRGTLFATGNNVMLVGDMVRRGLTIHLDAGVEVPEQRSFAFDPHERIRADRGRYVAAALTIARAYHVSGERADCPPIGSYGDWSRFAREPLVWLGLPDPVASMERAREEDPERMAARQLISEINQHVGVNREFATNGLVSLANEQSDAGALKRPELYDLLTEQCRPRGGTDPIDSKRLGQWLKRLRGQVHGGHKIEMIERAGHANLWRLREAGPRQGALPLPDPGSRGP